MKCPECGTKLSTAKHYDVVRLDDDDREQLKQASEKMMSIDPYLAGRLAGLSGRVPE